jgi:hypothetical protein
VEYGWGDGAAIGKLVPRKACGVADNEVDMERDSGDECLSEEGMWNVLGGYWNGIDGAEICALRTSFSLLSSSFDTVSVRSPIAQSSTLSVSA